MVKMKKKTRISKVSLSLMLAVAMLMTPQLAAAQATVPKTPAPPQEIIQPLGLYTGYTYLKSSNVLIHSNEGGTIKVSAQTESKSVVSEVSVTIQLQEWSGTSWINLIPTANGVSYSASSANAALSRYSRPGYYYRVKTTHTVKQGSITEQVTEYTDDFLAL